MTKKQHARLATIIAKIEALQHHVSRDDSFALEQAKTILLRFETSVYHKLYT